MNIVKIENGTYNNTEINGCFPLVKGITKSKDGSYFVKVKVSDSDEKVFAGRDACRIKIENQDQITEVSGSANKKLVETEDQAIERIAERFSILEEMTNATLDGIVRGMVVTGPPGVGKSFGVVVVGGHEIATFRKDIGKGRRPDAVDFTDIKVSLKQTLVKEMSFLLLNLKLFSLLELHL